MLTCATADIEHRSVYLACLDEFLIGLLWTTNIPRGNAQVGSIKVSATWTTLLFIGYSFIGCCVHRLEPST
jgi:hypothetical protein